MASISSLSVSSPLGVQPAASAISTLPSQAFVAQGAALPTTGVLIKGSSGIAFYFEVSNTTGGSIYIQLHNGTSTPSAGAAPIWYSANSIGTSGTSSSNFGHPNFGVPCSTGLYVVASSTQTTYTAIASTAVTYMITYL